MPISAAEPDYPANSVLLFVAAWCAPCRAELKRLDEIATAARPKAVRVVSFDNTERTEAMLRGIPLERMWRPTALTRKVMIDDLETRTAGLPFALATDERGQPCGESRRGLDAARTRALIADCRRH
jgi:thiol-disulfide isomerase/thioredoxin